LHLSDLFPVPQEYRSVAHKLVGVCHRLPRLQLAFMCGGSGWRSETVPCPPRHDGSRQCRGEERRPTERCHYLLWRRLARCKSLPFSSICFVSLDCLSGRSTA
jgi:hypothetical protein